MEEEQAVWNELDLSCLPDYDSSSITTPFPATNTLQDFHSSTILSSHFNTINSPTTEDSPSFSHAISLRPPPNKQPLSLNPEPNYLSFPFVETRAQPPLLSNPVQHSGSSTSLTTATTTTVVAKKQRVQKKSVIITPEKRYMQMIRNRGYALRARARKKATNNPFFISPYHYFEVLKALG
ncbi:uncharacterized protein LOC133806702 [Humulus lupulus]|uniref:uncharacterized protein LOC133806702 n=1 Tax=Humulus lupulus TaxID=3486 RepID=UPI002B40CA01|nr:uncharacterized protein LOC133806702 [Humulus lupulus]